MASTYKTLGQVAPAASTLTTLYTVPAATQAVGSTLTICNQGASLTYVNIAIRPAGAALDPKHYIMYQAYVSANNTLFLTLGISLAATDVVSVLAATSTVSFNLFGSEIA